MMRVSWMKVEKEVTHMSESEETTAAAFRFAPVEALAARLGREISDKDIL